MRLDVGHSPIPLGTLRALTQASDRFLIWKNIESALNGEGDLDCAAPQAEWTMLRTRLDVLATDAGLPEFVSCTHLPGVQLNVTIDPVSERIFEVDFCDRQHFRGRVLFSADSLIELAIDDPRGFRRLRPGAEALYLALLKGITRRGGLRYESLEAARVLAASDPEGARLAAEQLGRLGSIGFRLLVEAPDGWRRTTAMAAQVSAVSWLGTHPAGIGDRIRMRRRIASPCPVLQAVLHGRLVDDAAVWLKRAALEHRSP